jgi:hypothetical protein
MPEKLTSAAIARKNVLENPFNACHIVDGVPIWASCSDQNSSVENYRFSGVKAEPVQRIKDYNASLLTWAGRLDIYHKKLELLYKQALAKVVPFDYLPKL